MTGNCSPEKQVSIQQGYKVYSRPTMWKGGYIGMNYFAAKELKVPFAHDSRSVGFYSKQSKRDQAITTQHEVDEANLMRKGMKYKDAHRRVTLLERFANKSGHRKRISSR